MRRQRGVALIIALVVVALATILAARMGMEATGLTLPLANSRPDVTVRDVRTQAVIAGDSVLSHEADTKLREQDTAVALSESGRRQCSPKRELPP